MRKQLTILIIMITEMLYLATIGFCVSDRDFRSIGIISGWDDNQVFGKVSALSINNKLGYIGIIDDESETAFIFSVGGALIKRIDLTDGLKTPAGIAIGNDKTTYISDVEEGKIKAYHLNGTKSEIDLPADTDGKQPSPGAIVLDKKDNLYVADIANSKIIVLNSERKIIIKFGKKGNKRGEFESLKDIAVDRQGFIYALDSAGTPIQVFNKKGKYQYKIGYKGFGMEDITEAAGIFIDPNDQIWVTDKGSHSLKVYDKSGIYLKTFGEYGTETGKLFQPIDVVMNSFGHLLVLEEGANRIQTFMLKQSFERYTSEGL